MPMLLKSVLMIMLPDAVIGTGTIHSDIFRKRKAACASGGRWYVGCLVSWVSGLALFADSAMNFLNEVQNPRKLLKLYFSLSSARC